MRRAVTWVGMAVAVSALCAQAADPWQHVTQKSQPLLPGDEIQMVKHGQEKGRIWIGTLSGAARLDAGVMTPLKAAKGMRVWDITERPEGGFWIGHGEGALLVDGDRTVATLKGNTVASMQMVGTQMWAIAKNEATDRNTLMRSVGEDWVPVAFCKGRRVLDLVPDAKGKFWIVLDGDGVMEIDPRRGGDAFQHHLPRLNVTGILTDAKGRTWCGMMSGGVMVQQDKEWKRHLDKERTAALSLAEDGDGRIWVATSGNGVWIYDGEKWSGMLQEEGSVSLLKMTSDARIWVSSQRRGGLRYWNGKEWKDSLDSGTPVRCLTELPKGALIAGGVLDGLHILGDYSIKGE